MSGVQSFTRAKCLDFSWTEETADTFEGHVVSLLTRDSYNTYVVGFTHLTILASFSLRMPSFL